jgi:hypothetical protein
MAACARTVLHQRRMIYSKLSSYNGVLVLRLSLARLRRIFAIPRRAVAARQWRPEAAMERSPVHWR